MVTWDGVRLREYRISAGLRIDDLAAAAGRSAASITGVDAGQTSGRTTAVAVGGRPSCGPRDRARPGQDLGDSRDLGI